MNAKAKMILAGVLASVAIAGLWFVLLWSPTKDTLNEARAQEEAAEAQAAELQTKLAVLKNLEANKDRLEADRQLLSRAIPDKDQLDEFILQVNDRAGQAGIEFVSISPAPPAATAAPGAPAAGPQAVGLQIQVTGDYFAILRFMDLLRDGDRLVTVENFSLSKGGEGGAMSASIGGKMFLLGSTPTPDPAAAAPAA